MANKATNKNEPTTKTVVIDNVVKQVQVYSNGDNIRYRITFATEIPAIVRDRQSEEYSEGMVDYIDFLPRVLIAQCLDQIDGLNLLYTSKKEKGLRNGNESGFGATELQVVLRNAKVKIERTKFEAGDEYTDADDNVHTHEYAGYNTNLLNITVTDRVADKLEDMMDSVLSI